MVQDFVHQQYYVTSSKKILRAWAHWKGWFVITDSLTRTTLVSVISLANLILQYIVCRACWENIKHPPLACSTPQKINFMDTIMSKHVYINLSLHHLGGIYKMFIFFQWVVNIPMVFSHCFLASKISQNGTFAKVLDSTVALGSGTSFQHRVISWPSPEES